MEKKNLFLSGITRHICFMTGAMLLTGLYIWRITNLLGEKQEMAEKSVDELIESYFSPSAIYGWDKIAEEISVDDTWNRGFVSADVITTNIELLRDGKVFYYSGYFDKDSISETKPGYSSLRMRISVTDTYDSDIKEITVSSDYEGNVIDVYVKFSDRKESYSIGYEEGEYIPNFRMERDIKMSGKEIAALKTESRQMLEQIVYERYDSEQQDLKSITGSTICFIILLSVWALVTLPVHSRKKETLQVQEEKTDDHEKIR